MAEVASLVLPSHFCIRLHKWIFEFKNLTIHCVLSSLAMSRDLQDLRKQIKHEYDLSWKYHNLSADHFGRYMQARVDGREPSRDDERKQEEYADQAVKHMLEYQRLQDVLANTDTGHGSSYGRVLSAKARGDLKHSGRGSTHSDMMAVLESASLNKPRKSGRGAYRGSLPKHVMRGRGGFFGDVLSSIF